MIGVLGGFAPGADGDAALTPVLNSLGDVTAHAAAGRAADAARRAISYVDTGMARLGLDAGELARVSQDHGLLAGLELLYAMTHLACADEPGHPMNAAQAARFRGGLRGAAGDAAILRHLGLYLGPDFASDLARPGCALYGINPTPGQSNPMRGVVRLDAGAQVRDVPAGIPVGHGAT